MRNKNVIGVLILIVGFSGSSLAGFKDALKSAAGGALNEVTGTTLVLRDVLIQDSSSCSAEDFKKEHQFSDEECRQWLQDVIRQLKSVGWKLVPGISVDGMVADGKRAKISEDEAKKVFCTVENSGIFLAQDFAYFSAGDSFIKFNYATLSKGRCDERGDVLSNSESSRVISAIEKACDSAKEKIATDRREKVRLAQEAKTEQAKMAAKEKAENQAATKLEEKADIEKRESANLEALKKSRTGMVAYALSPMQSIQWGDSPEVLKKICNIDVPDDYYDPRIGSEGVPVDTSGKSVNLYIYPGVGVYSISIDFPSDTVTPEQLIEKYTTDYGAPVKEEKRGFSGILDKVIYRWNAKTHTVELWRPSVRVGVVLTRPELLKEIEDLKQKQKNVEEEKKKAETKKLLDF